MSQQAARVKSILLRHTDLFRLGAATNATPPMAAQMAKASTMVHPLMSTMQRITHTLTNAAQRAQIGPLASRVGQQIERVAQKYPRVTQPVVYWGRVGAALGREVWMKEKMSPPSLQQAQQSMQSMWRSVLQIKPGQAVQAVQNMSGEKVAGYGLVGLQVLGFFSIGEMIGRRHIVGYSISH